MCSMGVKIPGTVCIADLALILCKKLRLVLQYPPKQQDIVYVPVAPVLLPVPSYIHHPMTDETNTHKVVCTQLHSMISHDPPDRIQETWSVQPHQTIHGFHTNLSAISLASNNPKFHFNVETRDSKIIDKQQETTTATVMYHKSSYNNSLHHLVGRTIL